MKMQWKTDGFKNFMEHAEKNFYNKNEDCSWTLLR